MVDALHSPARPSEARVCCQKPELQRRDTSDTAKPGRPCLSTNTARLAYACRGAGTIISKNHIVLFAAFDSHHGSPELDRRRRRPQHQDAEAAVSLLQTLGGAQRTMLRTRHIAASNCCPPAVQVNLADPLHVLHHLCRLLLLHNHHRHQTAPVEHAFAMRTVIQGKGIRVTVRIERQRASHVV